MHNNINNNLTAKTHLETWVSEQVLTFFKCDNTTDPFYNKLVLIFIFEELSNVRRMRRGGNCLIDIVPTGTRNSLERLINVVAFYKERTWVLSWFIFLQNIVGIPIFIG